MASGDLTQQISVAARGEVADLKDTINKMIATLRSTTKENADQSWIDSNLARIGGLMQGQRDLGEICRLIMHEVTPLVNAQVGAFFLAASTERSSGPPEVRWVMTGGYGSAIEEPPLSFGPGEGLVGQVAIGKQRILVDDVPDGYLSIRSGVGTASPRAVVVLPVQFEGECLGVIELGSVVPFSALHLASWNA